VQQVNAHKKKLMSLLLAHNPTFASKSLVFVLSIHCDLECDISTFNAAVSVASVTVLAALRAGQTCILCCHAHTLTGSASP
jgi:hypothetical protein